MTARRLPSRAGYTLVEVLAASGLVAAAISAASALSMNMSRQEELTRGQSAATRYAEAVARLWQIGADPSAILLTQPYGKADAPNVTGDEAASLSYQAMSFTVSAPSATSMGDDGGIPQGSVEQATVTVTWLPYGSTSPTSIILDVLRPAAAHR